MEKVHPTVSFAATCAMIALALSGCRSSSSGIAGSPFMSPDRVPPPNTRVLLPGQAQPYYQGDPLPAMQSATKSPATVIAALPNEVETRSASGRTLAWSQPGATAPSPIPTSPVPPDSAPQPQIIATATEASVVVPNDGDPLRFPLPAPQSSKGASPIASASPLPIQPQLVQPVGAQPPSSNVLPASFNAPIPSAAPLPIKAPPMSAPQQAASPWRSPQAAQVALVPTSAPRSVVVQQFGIAPLALRAPPAIPANTMAATLRAVESPPQPGDPTPRVRMPGYVATEVSADGFRPRTSMQ